MNKMVPLPNGFYTMYGNIHTFDSRGVHYEIDTVDFQILDGRVVTSNVWSDYAPDIEDNLLEEQLHEIALHEKQTFIENIEYVSHLDIPLNCIEIDE